MRLHGVALAFLLGDEDEVGVASAPTGDVAECALERALVDRDCVCLKAGVGARARPVPIEWVLSEAASTGLRAM
jgi:hypothetical protein